jgi:long-chain acyl-CoA synthetase
MEVRAELPKTAVGKLSKKELYEEEARKQAAA